MKKLGPICKTVKPYRRTAVVCGVLCLLFILFLQLACSVRQESISWDEGDHTFAGYMMWKHDDFGLNPEHPPLVKLVAALPLLPMNLRVPILKHREFKLEAFLDGSNFMAWNYTKGILFRARMAVSFFTLLLALLIFCAAREMYGSTSGFIALILFVFDPNFLAHGALVATDVGVSCFIFGSIYCFYRYAKKPNWMRLVIAGGVTGLALSSKHTGLLLLPMFFALVICESLKRENGSSPVKRFLRLTGSSAIILLIGFVVLWAFYGFRYKARPAGLALNPPLGVYVQEIHKPFEEKVLKTFAYFHLLPEAYLYGIADIQHVDEEYTSYFFGKIYPHGTRDYFPAVILIKSTLPFLIMLLLTGILILIRKFTRFREILFFVLPPAIYLAVAMNFNMNIGMRHILPIYPFLYVLIAGGASVLLAMNRRWRYAIVLLLVWQVFEAIHVFPAYMAYANEAWGGPSATHKYLSDSNVDWGQQLIAVKRYLVERNIDQCWFVYFPEGAVNPAPYGIPCHFLPTTDTLWWLNIPLNAPPTINGTVLISDGDLAGFEFGPSPLNPYEQFKHLKPVAVIQHGVYVYHGHFHIPLAAAYSDDQDANNLLDAHKATEALPYAQEAFSLAPDNVVTNATLGDVLTALGHPEAARLHYEKALHWAKTVQPAFQDNWAAAMEARLLTNR